MAIKQYAGMGTKETRQSEPIPGKDMVQNSAGGFSFSLDKWRRLERFLILGSEGGSYYVSGRALTKKNADVVMECAQADGVRAVDIIRAISVGGRAPKNDPAIFALAVCASVGSDETKRDAFAALPEVARIGTHLFHFAQFVEMFRGWGRGLRKAVAQWYLAPPVKDVAYQALKYKNRDGWTHRDLLRLAHPKAAEESRHSLFRDITGKEMQSEWPDLAQYRAAKRIATASAKEAAVLIREFDLPREVVPSEHLNDKSVWAALLEKMPMTAIIRSLAKMTAVGLLKPMSDAAGLVCERLRDESRLVKARVHPIALLSALKVYEQGHGERGSLSWEPASDIVDALDDAFYLAFKAVEPTGKRLLLALDVSGSMGGGAVAGVPGLTPRVASAAMALVTHKVEPHRHIMAFADDFVPIRLSARERLDSVVRKVSGLDFGGTDCALPMLWAMKENVPIDCFVVYTDSETWAGDIHPIQALQKYREKTGIAAKLVVVGMVSNEFTIADPKDGGMLDVVGFDSAVPGVISQFAAA